MSSRVSKRKLQFTPSPRGKWGNAEKKAREAETERLVHRARGMEPPAEGAFGGADSHLSQYLDPSDIFDTVLQRYNQEAIRTGTKEGGGESKQSDRGIIEPLLKAMTTCMVEVMSRFMTKFAEGEARRREEEEVVTRDSVNSKLLLAEYKSDRYEQYSRRENMRIAGIAEEQGETDEGLEAKAVGVCKDLGVDVTPEAFDAVHRVGKKKEGKPRQVIVRFISRKVRDRVFSKKRLLRDQGKGIFLNDDLTPLRSKMMYAIKQTGQWNVWSVRGLLHCTKKLPEGVQRVDGQRPDLVIVETPDDLAKVGFNSIDLVDLGLHNVVLPEIDA